MNIPEMLAAIEEALANLYKAYALRFSNYKDFWNRMAKEEKAHASIIRGCNYELTSGLLKLNEKKFNKQALKKYSDYVKKELELVQEPRLSLVHALSAAFYIEHSLIDAGFLEVFEGGSIKLKRLLNQHKLNKQEHLDRVRQVIGQQG